MNRSRPHEQGFSLIEALVVIAIVSVLAIAGVVYLGNRPSAGVKGIVDELEGALIEAQKLAIATGRDVTIATAGRWTPGNPMVLVRGDSTIAAADWTNALRAAQGQGSVNWPPALGGMTTNQFHSLNLAFRLATSNGVLAREHLHAGVATDFADWTTSQGTDQSLESVPPFSSAAHATDADTNISGFSGQLTTGRMLFTGADSLAVSVSGTSKRFNQTFWIPVIAMSSGAALPNGPKGAIFVQANGGTVYKFYNPGTAHGGDGKWRRL